MFDVVSEENQLAQGSLDDRADAFSGQDLAVAPGWLMLNTTMGSLFSLHNPKALASITA